MQRIFADFDDFWPTSQAASVGPLRAAMVAGDIERLPRFDVNSEFLVKFALEGPARFFAVFGSGTFWKRNCSG